MDKCRKSIVVLEPSKILYEGLSASISKSEHDYSFFHVDNLTELKALLIKREISIVLVNPGMVKNRQDDFTKIKKQNIGIYWIAVIYSLFDNSVLKLFDDTFQITDDVSIILQKINKKCNNKSSFQREGEHLSERETNVLQWLAKGLSNKGIADKLNLSIHTVNTHRKNIMDKTGIRSLPGLTIYAVSKEIISLD